jgi:hypothetical protein
LNQVKQPTLVLSGTDDRLIPLANSAILAAHLPNSRLRLFDRWGHYLLHDPTSGAGTTVRDFFSAAEFAASTAWTDARAVTKEDLADFLRAAPKSANPVRFTNAFVRRRYPVRRERD